MMDTGAKMSVNKEYVKHHEWCLNTYVPCSTGSCKICKESWYAAKKESNKEIKKLKDEIKKLKNTYPTIAQMGM